MAAIQTNSIGSATRTSGHGSVMAAIVAAIAAAMARARARHEYRRLLASDEIMRDVGVDRAEVRRALMESGGRL
jgi:uncharacterized protein YjiS (DUF1127 family)